jgi:magnesium chelatase family protein
MVGAANPCLCGRLGDRGHSCVCPPARVESYRSRLSGPLLDRIDLHVEVPSLTEEELFDLEPSESSAEIRARVAEARRFRFERMEGMGEDAADVLSSLAPGVRRFLRRSPVMDGSSARGLARVLRVARSIADLVGSHSLEEVHVAEAVQFRRTVWGRQ